MDLGLHETTALVTAASRGLGRASALALAREGASVAICSRSREAVDATAAEIANATGKKVAGFVCDLADGPSIGRLINDVKGEFGSIDILVNNTGGPPVGDILALSEETWERGMASTLMSAVRLIRGALPMMMARGWGRVITIASFTAKEPVTDLLISSVARPGILGLTKVLANRYGGKNITFNTVLPGFILTKRQEELMEARSREQKITREAYLEAVARDIPSGRLGRPEEIGDVIAFLASRQASYINGANLLVDGGLTKGIH